MYAKYNYIMALLVMPFFTWQVLGGWIPTWQYWIIIGVIGAGHRFFRYSNQQQRHNEQLWRMLSKRY